MAASSEEPKICLVSSDDEEIVVVKSVAKESKIVKELLNDVDATRIPVKNVEGKILQKVIEYCKIHTDFRAKPAAKKIKDEKALNDLDAQFINVDQETLFALLLAAHYLHIKELYDFICKTIANMMNEKSTEEIRKLYNIKNDFTPEEVRMNQWMFPELQR